MPRATETRILDLVGSLYDQSCKLSPEGWHDVYVSIADAFSCGPGGIILRNEDYNRFDIAVGTTPPEFLREYEEHYQAVNPFRTTLKNLPVGAMFARSAVMRDDAFAKTAFYNDYLRKLDIFEYLSFPLFKSRGITAGLALTRPRSRPHFTAEEHRMMATLVPHLRRAVEIYMTVGDTKCENYTAATALTAMNQSVIVINKERKIRFASEDAENGLRERNGLRIARDGTLRAHLTTDDTRLGELLTGIFARRRKNFDNFGGSLLISRSAGYLPLQVRVTPFAAPARWGLGTEPMAMVFIHDPNLTVESQEKVLIDMYGLTKSEARLAAILAEGRSIEDACGILNVAENTARTHLRQIFLKTATHRQSELVRLIVRGVANLSLAKQSPRI